MNTNQHKINHLVAKEDLTNAENDMIKWLVYLLGALVMMIIGLYIRKRL